MQMKKQSILKFIHSKQNNLLLLVNLLYKRLMKKQICLLNLQYNFHL